MKIAMAVLPYTDDNLRTAKQLGVNDIVYYDMETMPLELSSLRVEVERLQRFDLKLTVIEAGPPMDRIVHGKDGRDEQIAQFQRCLEHMGKLGVEVMCYTFMPQVMDDSMVVRTTYEARSRGGAKTSAFRLADVTTETVPHCEATISNEAMWDNLEYFLKRVVPAAEYAGVKLALHPDDPPLSPICGLNRIMSSVEAFDRVIALSPSPVNGITLCQGCFLEMGADLPQMVRRFGDRIHYSHFRDVAGVPTDFVETFPDDGPTDFVAVFETFKEVGHSVPIRVDHVPRLAIEEGANDGYGFVGHAYATGYLKGLLESVYGKPDSKYWGGIPEDERAARYVSEQGSSAKK